MAKISKDLEIVIIFVFEKVLIYLITAKTSIRNT